jgi:hypothetical protein
MRYVLRAGALGKIEGFTLKPVLISCDLSA